MRRSTLSTSTLALALLAAAPHAGAQTIRTVRPAGPGATPPWTTAVTTLQAALAAAQSGDEIWIASGSYTATQADGFIIPPGVKVHGGFVGFEQSPAQRNPDLSLQPTVLVAASTAYHIVKVTNAASPVLIDRVTIQNGHGALFSSDATGASTRGAGIYATNSSITFIDCIIQGNATGQTATGSFNYTLTGDNGGGAYLSGCTTQFIRCVLANNHANNGGSLGCTVGVPQPNGPGGNGGAVCIASGSARFVDCQFIGNSSGSGGGGFGCATGNASSGSNAGSGGAIYATSAPIALTRCTFSSNATGSGGGGGSSSACFGTFNGAAGSGGAIYQLGGFFSADACSFLGNHSGSGGGGTCAVEGTAGGSGGAVFTSGSGPPRISNCLFKGNYTGAGGPGGIGSFNGPMPHPGGNGGPGGAIFVASITLVTNSTFVGNATGQGGMGGNTGTGSSAPNGARGIGGAIAGGAQVYNSVLWSNTPTQYDGPSVDWSCVQDQAPGPNGTNADPLFFNSGSGDYHLQPSSPCINSANSALYQGDSVDLDAKPRIVSGCVPGLIGATPQPGLDMGAYEFQFATPDCNTDGICDTREVSGLAVLVPAAPQSGQRFGWALALSPHFAAVGSRSKTTPQGTGTGEVVAYDRIAPTGSTALSAFASPTSISSPDAAANDDFGNQAVITESPVPWLIVGARFADLPSATDAGAAYAFQRTGASWTFTQKLTAPTPTTGAEFAHGLAIDGSTLIAGSLHANSASANDTGAATVFSLQNNTWAAQSTLSASDAATGDGFGISVGLSANTAVIGAPYRSDNGPLSGAAYIFTRSGSTWTQSAKLIASDGQMNDTFGELVAISGDTILVSAPRHTVLGQQQAGAVYVFRQSSPGGSWTQTAILTSNQPRTSELFGFALTIDNDAAAIGGFHRSNSRPHDGSAYIFRRIGGGGGVSGQWVRATRIDNPEPDTDAYFGYGIALNGTSFLVGAPQQTVAGVQAVGSVRTFDLAMLDANHNGQIDSCEIAASTLPDSDHNGIPDLIQPTRCAQDFDADGVLTPTDILAFLDAWFAGLASADYNASGTVEVQDIFDYLNAWFAGC